MKKTKKEDPMGEKGSITDPVSELQRRWKQDDQGFAVLVGITTRYLSILKAGGAHSLPNPLLGLVEQYEGPEAREKLVVGYERFREALSAERKAELERRFFPAGRWAGSDQVG